MTQLAASETSTAGQTSGDVFEPIRTAGERELEQNGLPTGREEAWRHTKIGEITRMPFDRAGPGEPGEVSELFDRGGFKSDAAIELVFVNGRFSEEMSRLQHLPDGLTACRLVVAGDRGHSAVVEEHLNRVARMDRHPFAAVNTAALEDGVYLHVKRNQTVPGVIHLLFLSTGTGARTASHPRVLVVLEDNSEVTVVESFVGAGSRYLTNAVTEIVAGRDCRIDHCKLQQEDVGAFHTAVMAVEIGAGTQFVSHAMSIGARISRNDLSVDLLGRGAYATLNGLVLLDGQQHCDNHTLLNHAAPDCPSHELYKHVLSDSATGVFKGQIYVNQIAQKTNAKQSSKSLLLSDKAQMHSMPALEIYADDVKCTHGSTIGPIDEDLIFYLRSRGVGYEAARHLLTYAFAADVTRRIKVEPVRRRVEDYMAAQHGLPQDLRINDLGAFDEEVVR